jgi:hypothetical protein
VLLLIHYRYVPIYKYFIVCTCNELILFIAEQIAIGVEFSKPCIYLFISSLWRGPLLLLIKYPSIQWRLFDWVGGYTNLFPYPGLWMYFDIMLFSIRQQPVWNSSPGLKTLHVISPISSHAKKCHINSLNVCMAKIIFINCIYKIGYV